MLDELDFKILEKLDACGFQYKTVDISHLPELLETIHQLGREGGVDKRISDSYFRYLTDTTNKPPDARTIIVIAMPSPITNVSFVLSDRTLQTVVPPQYIGASDDKNAAKSLKGVLELAGYKVTRARLPLKTLAVRSGLASYGRNNISYVPALGSFLRLIAFYTDLPCAQDNWQDARLMKACDNCDKCRENCPTGAIASDRFIVHAERCLTFLNENTGDFPVWAPAKVHNALIGCIRCQEACPVDKPQLNKVQNGPVFTEKEMAQILEKTPVNDLAPETRQKLKDIAYDGTFLYRFLARNLEVLIKK